MKFLSMMLASAVFTGLVVFFKSAGKIDTRTAILSCLVIGILIGVLHAFFWQEKDK